MLVQTTIIFSTSQEGLQEILRCKAIRTLMNSNNLNLTGDQQVLHAIALHTLYYFCVDVGSSSSVNVLGADEIA
jgi:hypothetical protein